MIIVFFFFVQCTRSEKEGQVSEKPFYFSWYVDKLLHTGV